MPGAKGSARSKTLLAPVIIAVVVSLMMFSVPPSHAETLAEDKLDAMLLTPPGWAAMVLYPLGISFKNVCRVGFTAYQVNNPLSRMGDHIEKKAIRPMLDPAQGGVLGTEKEKHLLPGLAPPRRGYKPHATRGDFFSEDLARSVKIPGAR